MSEKIFSLKDEKTLTDYRLTVSYNSFTLEFILQNASYIKERYESGNLSLPAFHQKNKIFKQFDNILKIAEVIRNKMEKKQYSLQSGVLTLKFHDEYNNLVNIPFELKPVDFSKSNKSETQKGDIYKKRVSDLNIKVNESKLSSGTSSSSSYKPPVHVTQPPKPKVVALPPQNPPKPKPTPPPVQKPQNPPSSKPSNPEDDKFFYKPSSKPQIQIVGSYVPPSMNKSGTIWKRIEQCKKLKTNMQKTLEDIYNRLLDVKKRIDNYVDKAFANNPTPEVRKKALDLITEVLILRQGFKDIDDYAEIFQNEVKENNLKFNATEKEKFDDDMLILGKAFPYALTPFHQKIDHLFIQVQHNFFKEKNLRFYKEREIADILKYKEKLFGKQ